MRSIDRGAILAAGLATLAAVTAAAACGGDDAAPEDRPPLADLGSGPADAGVAPDAGAPIEPPLPPPCDPIRNDGCAGDRVCRVQRGCQPAPATPRGLDEACRVGECGPGLSCLRLTATASAACARLCDVERGAGCGDLPGERECRFRIGDTAYGACSELPPPCNPIRQTPCEPTEACQPFLRRTGARELRCQPAGAQPRGAPCGVEEGSCERGTACIAAADGRRATCRAFCERNADCPPPEQCTGSVEEPRFNFCLP